MDRLAGKVTLIAGAGSGIGAAIARLFAAEGAQLMLADVKAAALGETASGLSSEAATAVVDVSQDEDWARIMHAVVERWGRLDVLVNTAGYFRPARIEDAAESDLRRMFEVNQLGTFLGIKHAIAPMRQGGGGSIVVFSSQAGLAGMPTLAGYSSTKFAVRGITQCAAMELGEYGIRINSVHPGGVDTPMVTRTAESLKTYDALPISRIGRPEELAYLTLFLASDESSYSTGSEFVADGGMGAGYRPSAIGSAGG